MQDFLNHLAEQPACFETEIAHFAETLNGCVTTCEALQVLVELIYQQVMCWVAMALEISVNQGNTWPNTKLFEKPISAYPDLLQQSAHASGPFLKRKSSYGT